MKLPEENGAGTVELDQELLQLRGFISGAVIEFEQLAYLLQRETQALAPQRELQSCAIAIAEYARSGFPARREQSFILVMAQRAGGDAKLTNEVRNRVRLGHCAMQYLCVD